MTQELEYYNTAHYDPNDGKAHFDASAGKLMLARPEASVWAGNGSGEVYAHKCALVFGTCYRPHFVFSHPDLSYIVFGLTYGSHLYLYPCDKYTLDFLLGSPYYYTMEGNPDFEDHSPMSGTIEGSGNIYLCENGTYNVHCYDTNHELVWEYTCGAYTRALLLKLEGEGEEETLYLYVGCDDGKVYKLDASDGSLVNYYNVSGSCSVSYAFDVDSSGNVYAPYTYGIRKVELSTNTIVWSYEFPDLPASITSVIFDGDDVFFGMSSSAPIDAEDITNGFGYWFGEGTAEVDFCVRPSEFEWFPCYKCITEHDMGDPNTQPGVGDDWEKYCNQNVVNLA